MIGIQNDLIIHFIGIGGIGMSGIAEVLLNLGYKVTGSDIAEGGNVLKLKDLGAKISLGHKRENINDQHVIVYSSAIDEKNPEVLAAREKNIPLIRRAEMLSELMRLKYGIAVAGTHGKTTTTSFLATILSEAKKDPTHIIGGIVSNLGGHARLGKGEFLVAEADESDGSFLLLSPILSVITNVDFDHLDFYGSKEKLIETFEEFSSKVPFYGLVSFNIHDPVLTKIRKTFKRPFVTYGLSIENNEEPDFMATNIEMSKLGSKFDLVYKGEKVVEIKISLPGEHNILNSLGAISIAQHLGIDFETIANGINKFKGVGRRLEQLYEKDEFEIVDDYGHHPTEIRNTIETVRRTRPGKNIVVVFEPHRFSRTKFCWEDFLHSFNSSDRLYLCPIYPASEKPIKGIHSDRLAKDINELHPELAESLENLNDIENVVKELLGTNSIVLTLGAGSIGREIREVVKKLI